ncbi:MULTISPECIES: DNA adenine methylase [Desulforamulus]|nr:DNA adenine methylase [Desulforamulus profundi]
MNIAPVLKYPGSKWKLADWIVSHLPKHTTYLEPFFGSGAIFFNKIPSKVETINDIDGNVVNLFRVIREKPEELARLVEFTPWARDEYYLSYEKSGDLLEDARRFLVRCWQAWGVSTNRKTGWRSDIKGRSDSGYSCPKQWTSVPQRIIQCANRLRQAQIENEHFSKLIPRYALPNVLIYCDPPYPVSTKSQKLYAHEMTDTEHLNLLDLLDRHPGPVLLSGYACHLYDTRLQHWERRTTKALAEGGREREEILWINPIAAEEVCGLRLF